MMDMHVGSIKVFLNVQHISKYILHIVRLSHDRVLCIAAGGKQHCDCRRRYHDSVPTGQLPRTRRLYLQPHSAAWFRLPFSSNAVDQQGESLCSCSSKKKMKNETSIQQKTRTYEAAPHSWIWKYASLPRAIGELSKPFVA